MKELFIRQYKISPNRYIVELRIDYACDLLCENKYTVIQIAALFGFYDVYWFCRYFKKHRHHACTIQEKICINKITKSRSPFFVKGFRLSYACARQYRISYSSAAHKAHTADRRKHTDSLRWFYLSLNTLIESKHTLLSQNELTTNSQNSNFSFIAFSKQIHFYLLMTSEPCARSFVRQRIR